MKEPTSEPYHEPLNSAHTFTIYVSTNNFNIILTNVLKRSVPFRFSYQKLNPFYSITVCVTCPAHLILLHLITLIIFCLEYKSWSSSFSSFLFYAVISSLLSSSILLRTLFSSSVRLWTRTNVVQKTHRYTLPTILPPPPLVLHHKFTLFVSLWWPSDLFKYYLPFNSVQSELSVVKFKEYWLCLIILVFQQICRIRLLCI
jgi:hypothetical protein